MPAAVRREPAGRREPVAVADPVTAGGNRPVPARADGSAPRRRGRPRKAAQQGLPSPRERLLEAAAQVFAEYGFEYATLDQVARRAGFAQSAIYNHFGGKPELLLEVVKSTFGALRVIRGAPDQQLRSPSVLSEFLGRLLSPENATLRALTIEAHVAARHHPEVKELLDRYHRESVVLIRDLVARWQSDGLAGPNVDPERAAQLFLTLALGCCNLETVSPEFTGDVLWLAMVDAQIATLLGLTEAGRNRRRAGRGS